MGRSVCLSSNRAAYSLRCSQPVDSSSPAGCASGTAASRRCFTSSSICLARASNSSAGHTRAGQGGAMRSTTGRLGGQRVSGCGKGCGQPGRQAVMVPGSVRSSGGGSTTRSSTTSNTLNGYDSRSRRSSCSSSGN